MKQKLLVVTDLGSFKAYRLNDRGLNSRPSLELVDHTDFAEGHAKLSEQTTDQAGQFRRMPKQSGDFGYMSDGEQHNIVLEQRRRLVKKIAGKLTDLMGGPEVDACFFAANNDINHQIMHELSQSVRGKIEKNVTANLTKIDKADLLGHF